jgi:hypothetical protein
MLSKAISFPRDTDLAILMSLKAIASLLTSPNHTWVFVTRSWYSTVLFNNLLQTSDPLNPAKIGPNQESYTIEDMVVHKHPATSFVDEVRGSFFSLHFYLLTPRLDHARGQDFAVRYVFSNTDQRLSSSSRQSFAWKTFAVTLKGLENPRLLHPVTPNQVTFPSISKRLKVKCGMWAVCRSHRREAPFYSGGFPRRPGKKPVVYLAWFDLHFCSMTMMVIRRGTDMYAFPY